MITQDVDSTIQQNNAYGKWLGYIFSEKRQKTQVREKSISRYEQGRERGMLLKHSDEQTG
jgi:hypothetical protein